MHTPRRGPGRPRKYSRPARAETVTLPEDVLERLAGIDCAEETVDVLSLLKPRLAWVLYSRRTERMTRAGIRPVHWADARAAADGHVRKGAPIMLRRTASAWLVTFALLIALPAALAAHLSVLKTMPADGAALADPPPRVEVWFDQRPSPRVSRLDLKGPDGDVTLEKVAVNAEDRSISAAVTGNLAPGKYEVTWRTAGHDGHVQRGTFSFVLKGSQ